VFPIIYAVRRFALNCVNNRPKISLLAEAMDKALAAHGVLLHRASRMASLREVTATPAPWY
jgi:hypothetical protein